MNGRFLINRGDAKVMGVAAGLADYTGVDATIIRLAFVAATLLTGPVMILFYVLAGLLAPTRLAPAALSRPLPQGHDAGVGSPDPFHLQRFVDAQQGTIDTALAELAAGSKQSHWMWFVFPQLAGLGSSPTAMFYAIASLREARAYLDHPLLGPRLRQCVAALEPWAGKRSAEQIFGTVDAMKLKSSLTLFDQVEPSGVFAAALVNFFGGRRDERTLALLDRAQ
jgi:uncharacterized protein (DUF1810 family)/phage shock protein PspC (stress-responsive transcriptional regulator)